MGQLPSWLQLPAWQWWAIAGVVLLILELMTQTFFILWISVGAFVAAGVAALWGGWVPWAVFAASSAILLWLTRPLARKLHEATPVRTNVDELIGQKAIVVETIDPVANRGRVRVRSDEWRARAGRVIPQGSYVLVKSVSGTTLWVEPAGEEAEEGGEA